VLAKVVAQRQREGGGHGHLVQAGPVERPSDALHRGDVRLDPLAHLLADAELVVQPDIGGAAVAADRVRLKHVRDDDPFAVRLDVGVGVADGDAGGDEHVGVVHRICMNEDAFGHGPTLARVSLPRPVG